MINEKAYIVYEGFLFQVVGKNPEGVTIIVDGTKIQIPARQAKYCTLAEFLKN